jgi:hypothetical protein
MRFLRLCKNPFKIIYMDTFPKPSNWNQQDSKICKHIMNSLDLIKKMDTNWLKIYWNTNRYQSYPYHHKNPIPYSISFKLQYTLCTRFKSWSYGIWYIQCNKTWPHIQNIIPYLFKTTLIFTYPIIKQFFSCKFHRTTRSVVFLKNNTI